MTAFLAGAAAPARAVGLFRRAPRLLRYVVVPVLVSLAAAALLGALLLSAGFRLASGLLEGTDGALALVLRVLVIAAVVIVVGFLLVRFGVVLGSPWYGRLSEEIEVLLTGAAPPAEPLTVRGITRDLGRALRFEAAKLVLLVTVGVPLLLANLVPAAGQAVAGAGGLALGATIACLDLFDGPLERRRATFRQKLRFVRATLPGSAGFGLVCAALLAIPLVNLLLLPLCVAAGTAFWCDNAEQKRAEPGEVESGRRDSNPRPSPSR